MRYCTKRALAGCRTAASISPGPAISTSLTSQRGDVPAHLYCQPSALYIRKKRVTAHRIFLLRANDFGERAHIHIDIHIQYILALHKPGSWLYFRAGSLKFRPGVGRNNFFFARRINISERALRVNANYQAWHSTEMNCFSSRVYSLCQDLSSLLYYSTLSFLLP